MNHSAQATVTPALEAPDISIPLPLCPDSFTIADLSAPDPKETLLGDRWLCRGGSCLLVGSSGIGKSSASMQMDLLWACGREAFGIKPRGPLKIVTIQAENDRGDLYYMSEGVTQGLNFTQDEILIGLKNLRLVHEQSRTGEAFVREVVEPLLEKHRPDLLRIDPLLAYAGGDMTKPEVSGKLLRTLINPLLTKYKCGLILVNHSPKPTNNDTSKWRATDFMYSGSGGHDIVNWARSVLVISATNQRGTFEFIAAKRGGIGWKDSDGVKEWSQFYKHAEAGIWWEAAEEPPKKVTGGIGKNSPKTRQDILMLLPAPPESVSQHMLIAKAAESGIGKQTTMDLLKALEEDPEGIERFSKENEKRAKGKKPVYYRRKSHSLHVVSSPGRIAFIPGECASTDLIAPENEGLSNTTDQEVLFDSSSPPKGELLPIK